MSVGAALGGMLLGALAGGFLGNKTPSYSASASSGGNYMASLPEVPSVPDPGAVAKPGEETETEKAMREAAEKEQAEAAKRKQNSQSVFTSPLGATGQASVYRKQLLGA